MYITFLTLMLSISLQVHIMYRLMNGCRGVQDVPKPIGTVQE